MVDEAWKRLGRLLIQRRVELGFPKRATWARDVLKLTNDRVQSDIENGRRTNYDPSTIALIEQQYRWEPGSIEEVLKGGEPRPRPLPELYLLPSGLRPETPATVDGADLSAMYGSVVVFTETIRKLGPAFSSRAVTLMVQAARLYADALRVVDALEGGDESVVSEAPGTMSHLVAADEQEQSISGEQEESETP